MNTVTRVLVALACLAVSAAALAADKPYISTFGPQAPAPTYLVDPTTGLAVTPSVSGSSNVATGQVTIGTTATLVVAARAGRASVKITDLGTTDLFCGPAGVTTATGDLLAGVKGAALTIATAAAVYCVVGTGTQAVSFMEVY